MQCNYVRIMFAAVFNSTLRQQPSLVTSGNIELGEALCDKKHDKNDEIHFAKSIVESLKSFAKSSRLST